MVSPHLKPIVIAGPTASGKSALALYLAKKYHGEIVCADSRQFYKGLKIGTAQPQEEELSLVPHHGYGIIDPKEQIVDTGFFINFVHNCLKDITSRNKRPIIVGGTGLYLRALTFGLDAPKKDPKIREGLLDKKNKFGLDYLYDELKEIDEDSSIKINPHDEVRIIRALEIFYFTKEKPSVLRNSFNKKDKKFQARFLYLNIPMDDLGLKIKTRIETMFNLGLIEETSRLLEILPRDSFVFKTMGYEETKDFLLGKDSLEKTKEKIFIRHKKYAKRQVTWFKKEDFYWCLKNWVRCRRLIDYSNQH